MGSVATNASRCRGSLYMCSRTARERGRRHVVVARQARAVGHRRSASRGMPQRRACCDRDAAAFRRSQPATRRADRLQQRLGVEVLADLHQHRRDLAQRRRRCRRKHPHARRAPAHLRGDVVEIDRLRRSTAMPRATSASFSDCAKKSVGLTTATVRVIAVCAPSGIDPVTSRTADRCAAGNRCVFSDPAAPVVARFTSVKPGARRRGSRWRVAGRAAPGDDGQRRRCSR